MAQISDTGLEAIKGNNLLIGRLMILYNRGQKTIENWIASRDSRLATPKAVQIISEETGLEAQQLLTEEVIENGTSKVIS